MFPAWRWSARNKTNMAESRKKKKSPRQKESDTEIEQRGETINNYLTLNNPGIVQVGSGNVVFKEGKSLLDDTQGGISKNDVFVGMVNSIINPTCSEKAIEMSLKIVEERFTKQYRRHCSTVKSFKDAYGAPLRKFIETNSEYYDMYSTKGKQTIRLKWRGRKKSEASKEERKGVTCTASVHSDPQSTLPLKEARNECTEEEKVEVQKLGEASGYATENDIDEENLNLEPWQQQKSKRREKKSVLKDNSVETSQSTSKEESTSSGTEEIYNSERFMVRDLLRKDESDVLLFYQDESIYMDGQAIFMQDIVSLWNTPSRHTSSVVIGVCLNQTKPHSVVGVRVRSSDDFYQAYFNKDHFSMMPNFKYKEVVYQDKVIGIIDVQSSYGHGVPSVVTKDFTDSNLTLTAGQLWVRSGRQNRLSLPQDFLTGQIYQWFGGTGLMSVVENTETTRHAMDKGDFKYPDEEYSTTIKRGVTTADFCSAVDYFKKGHFVLITGSLPESARHVDNLALVSWLAVYDFEESSRHTGLLSCLEDVIKKKRFLHVSTWKDSPQGITESGTQWICLRGLCEIPDTQTSHNPNGWLQLVKGNLNSTCLNLARFSEDYTVLRLIVLWPDNEIQAQCVYKFLCKLNDHFHVQPKIIVCLLQELNSSVGKSVLQLLESDFNTNLVQLKIDLESLCLSVGNMLKEISKQREMDYSLPKQEGHMHADVTDKDAAWLCEDLVVLYLSSPYTKGEADVEELTKEVDSFFKGGSLHWCARYAFGTTHVDVERDIMKSIIEHVEQKLIKEFRSATVTIFHAPGAGGTTLAQRILWELRKICPCCQLKQRPGILIEEVLAKIQYLYDVSGLPVVLLIDGEDEPRVKQIMKKLKSGCIIVIYAKRYPYAIKEPLRRPKDNKFWLRGEVTEDEAKILSFKFLERCQEDNTRKKVLSKMCKDVQQKKRPHVMYEFGMAVYHHEFRGIKTYVKGYLRLEENPTRDLLSWQKILGYLSLVYFYGQTSMPCQVFARLLGKQSNFDVCIDDFPYPIMEFVVEDASDGREKNIRISNYYLAKEILEQVLNRSSTKQDTRLQTLSRKAKHNLKEFCLEFISMFSSRRTRSSLTAHNIIKILTRTFIYRDNKDVGENEVQIKKRPLFSQLICDIDMNSPFTGRLEVLRRLSSSFPDDPNFLAHLGRFYAHCRPEEEDKAKKCFEDALGLCKKWNDGPFTSVTEEWRKLTLMHIYHMYGIIYQRHVIKFTGRSYGSKPEIETTEGEFNLRIEELVRDADIACSYFTLCRQNAPSGNEECYGYSSEILVRLQVCDFVNRNYTNGGVSGFLTKHGRHGEPVAEFIMDSITEIEDMILECYSLIDHGHLDQTFHSAVLWHDQLFERNMFDINRLDTMSVQSRRLLIAANKLKYTRKGHRSVFEISSISQADIIEFINLYEENFKDASVMGDFSKRQLESDFKEWLVAIRHPHFPSTYSEHDVLSKVRYWYETLHSPTSTYYLFVVLSLVGFGSAECKGNSESLVQAQMLKDDMDKFIKSVSKPRYPQEWLGKNNSGIKRLIPQSRLSAHIEGRNIQSTSHSLLVCKGTIAHPNSNRLSGYIDLDLGQNSVPVKVFFIPLRAGLVGTRFAGQRVQFYLAFSFHGNEAYNVQELTKHQCLVCLKKTEIQMDKETVQCSCGAVVEKHELL